MARANIHFMPGYIWHITHRCQMRKFLFKFSRDRTRWLHWSDPVSEFGPTRFSGTDPVSCFISQKHMTL
jgi:hypothetical protein